MLNKATESRIHLIFPIQTGKIHEADFPLSVPRHPFSICILDIDWTPWKFVLQLIKPHYNDANIFLIIMMVIIITQLFESSSCVRSCVLFHLLSR